MVPAPLARAARGGADAPRGQVGTEITSARTFPGRLQGQAAVGDTPSRTGTPDGNTWNTTT
jgi:hypothetical protein